MKPFEQRGSAILRRLPDRGRAVEVGVLIGALSEYLLQSRADLTLLMVDSWAPSSEQPERYKATRDVHAHHDFARANKHRQQAAARVRRFGNRAVIMDMTSTEASALVPDGSLDLVFLDADHSYEGVKADLLSWEPKVRPGGWIGGHDFANPDPAFRFGVDKAVIEWAAGRAVETDLNFTWFCRIEE